MYIQEISLEIKSKINKNELIDDFSLLLEFYRANGQTQGRIETQYIDKNTIVCLPFTLEKNSLDKVNNNKYVENQIEKIEKLSTSKISIKTVGKLYADYTNPCTCKSPAFYILITNYVSIDSPISCGSCNKSIPLYRLPQYYDFGYMPILSWETNYQSCDRLQMNCEVGERWALNQMQQTKSQLSKQGITICEKIKEFTNIPTYYYLHNYRKHKKGDENRLCPTCQKKWKLDKKLHNFYDFKCDQCRILSTVSPNL
ncbi:DUF2310 family Zn-ribbon-containing protein [Chryseobacterium sp. ERMR1:04]|uniref:DUF2310 family Zn-ribbon-containing protein n=1 Tax=Chryseobacterium sp. ERMR1:04 TaxID=1705393 RepID=UPI0006C89A58|nr:DUF2310 family Zn-ribbon-containing protein [Chryseobacterium sp. ERMR1:04]KPH12446.1 DNA-binding protein [Chryseobacterium sp. ERMR1:04]